MFQLITSASTRLNQVFIFSPLKLYPSLETLLASPGAGGTSEDSLITAVSSLGTAFASCDLLLPVGAIWHTEDPLCPASSSVGSLRVSGCHTEYHGHGASDPRVTVRLPRSHIQEADPGRGREPATVQHGGV